MELVGAFKRQMKIAFFVQGDFNLGAAYVIAYLKSVGHKVKLFFEFSQRLKFERNPLKEFNPDLVAFSCVTANKGWALESAKNIRDNFSMAILFGGVHPTLCPEDFKGYNVCQGDGIAYFGGKFDPDNLWPDREIFFEQLPPVHRAYQIFMTGFGCPFRCSYCNNHQLHPKIIRRNPQNCIGELLYLKSRGLRYVLFDDDIFTINNNWLLSFLSDYKRRVNLPFTCFGHAKYIDDKIANLLKESGCECVWLGVQSGVEETRHKILNRPETNEEIRNACQFIKRNKLKLMIDHIFGLPLDNYDKLLISYNFYKELKPDVVNCYELLYFPKAAINKYGQSQAMYQRQGGRDYQRYAKSFTSLSLLVN